MARRDGARDDAAFASGGEHRAGRLYEEHGRAEFPARLRDSKLAGVDLVLLDADIAGCITTWLSAAVGSIQHAWP